MNRPFFPQIPALFLIVSSLLLTPAGLVGAAAAQSQPLADDTPVRLIHGTGTSGDDDLAPPPATPGGGATPGQPAATGAFGGTPTDGPGDILLAAAPAEPPQRPEPPAKEIPGRGGAATTASAQFPAWFRGGLAMASGWRFPTAINKYGKRITPEDFFAAIIWIESNGVHRDGAGRITTSWSGARGFGQLMPNTARGLSVNPDDPAQNLKGSAKYLGEILAAPGISRIQDPAKKLIMTAAAYNMGPYSPQLKHDWDVFKGLARAETVGYGLKLKMCLGFEMTPTEKQIIARLQGVGVGQIDGLANDYYGFTRGIAAKKGT
jgi:hypothetical protein